jgi:hypothetical protein
MPRALSDHGRNNHGGESSTSKAWLDLLTAMLTWDDHEWDSAWGSDQLREMVNKVNKEQDWAGHLGNDILDSDGPDEHAVQRALGRLHEVSQVCFCACVDILVHIIYIIMCV